jgi:oligoribonuclease
MSSVENIVWLDVETNGIDAQENYLLEVAALVTDIDLNIVDAEGYQAVVKYNPSEVDLVQSMTNDYVLNMHSKTGLWRKLPSGKPLAQIDDELLAYISHYVPTANTAPLGGNSITLDRNFINFNLPKASNHIHYRSVDVTSIAILANAWKGLRYEKKTVHSAFSDITESIDELKFYREHFLK